MGFGDWLGSVVQKINPLGWAEKAYNWIGENYKPVLDTIKKIGSTVKDITEFVKPITDNIPMVGTAVNWINSAAKAGVGVSDTLNSIGDRVYQRQEGNKPAMNIANNGSGIERMSMRPTSTTGMEYAKPLGRR